MGRHAGGKRFIHSPKDHKENTTTKPETTLWNILAGNLNNVIRNITEQMNGGNNYFRSGQGSHGCIWSVKFGRISRYACEYIHVLILMSTSNTDDQSYPMLQLCNRLQNDPIQYPGL